MKTKDSREALALPPKDESWAEKIEQALKARKDTRKLRGETPIAFPTRRRLSR